MFSRPTTEQVLDLIADDLRDAVLPDVRSEVVRVMVQQMEQIVRSCARRAGHEIAWVHDEAETIASATGSEMGAPASLHLDDVVAWYDASSRVLSAALDAAFASGDPARIAEIKAVLDARSATEMSVIGTLDLVGRG